MTRKPYYAEHREEIIAQQKKYYAEHKEEIAARAKKYYAEHKEEIYASGKKYRAEHKEEMAAYQKKYQASNKEEKAAYGEKRRLMKGYGITLDVWSAMNTAQDGKCAICGGPPNGQYKKFHVDHDHATGTVRGLLCGTCNTGIGLLKDNTEILASAISYLKGHQP